MTLVRDAPPAGVVGGGNDEKRVPTEAVGCKLAGGWEGQMEIRLRLPAVVFSAFLGALPGRHAPSELVRLSAHVDNWLLAETLPPVIDCFRQGRRIARVVCEVENVTIHIDYGCVNLPAGRRHDDRFHGHVQSPHSAYARFRPEVV